MIMDARDVYLATRQVSANVPNPGQKLAQPVSRVSETMSPLETDDIEL
jgi:hypothetical protein